MERYPGSREAAVVVEGAEAAQDLIGSIGTGPDTVDEIGAGQVQQRPRNRLGAMLEEGSGLVAEQLLDAELGGKRCGCHGVSRCKAAIRLDA